MRERSKGEVQHRCKGSYDPTFVVRHRLLDPRLPRSVIVLSRPEMSLHRSLAAAVTRDSMLAVLAAHPTVFSRVGELSSHQVI